MGWELKQSLFPPGFLAQQLKKKINGTKRLKKHEKLSPWAKREICHEGQYDFGRKRFATAPESAENPAEAAKGIERYDDKARAQQSLVPSTTSI